MLRKAVCSLLFAILLSGCLSAYSAPAPVVPLLKGRGEIALAVQVRPAFPARAATASAAAAPSEHTRVYASAALSRAVGDRQSDLNDRTLKERNDTAQGELGAGWGTSGPHMRAEILAGVGYGKAHSAQCRRTIVSDEPWCDYWVDGRNHFVRASVQAQAAGTVSFWTGGGGVRLSFVRFAFSELLGEASDRQAGIAVIEPFLLHRFAIPYGFVQVMLDVPIVAASPRVTVRQGYQGSAYSPYPAITTRLVETPVPRIFLGYQLSFHELWRGR